METNWNLSEIYPSFEDSAFLNDVEEVKNKIEDFTLFETQIQNMDVLKGLESYIQKLSCFSTLVYRLESYISLTLSVETTHSIALKYSDILEGLLTNIVEPMTKIEKWIASIQDLDQYIEQSELLKTHAFFLSEIVKMDRYSLSAKEENIIANMKNTGSNAWAKLKDQLISTHKVELDGQELPLTVVLNMAYDENKEVRKKAYEAEIASYKKIEQGVAACLNGIKGEVLTECALRGYESPLEKTLISSRMSKKTLDVMLEAIVEALPKFREYLKVKAKYLGYTNGLPFYELYAPVTSEDMSFDYEKGSKFVVDQFRTFSSHLADFAKGAIEKSWIDVYPKEGKVGGAFCSNLHFIKQSRFLLNYGNSFNDVVTLSHELGHGFHGECLKDETILNADYPMPIAETASTFSETIIKKAAIKEANDELGHGFHGECLKDETILNADYPMPIAETASTFSETIIKKAAIKEANDNEALAILETEISGCTQVIVDIYSRFLFEKHLFEERATNALSVDRIKTLMVEAQKEAYGDGLDENYLHPYMWTWKPHYYYASSNFYNFPYAFGLLLAKGLYAKYKEEGSTFASKYEQFLSYTGKATLEDVAQTIGIDLTDKAFWQASLETIIEDIDEFKKLI